MEQKIKTRWLGALYRSLWGLGGTMNFFALAALANSIGLIEWEVPWLMVGILSVLITIFLIPWWWIVEWASRTFRFLPRLDEERRDP